MGGWALKGSWGCSPAPQPLGHMWQGVGMWEREDSLGGCEPQGWGPRLEATLVRVCSTPSLVHPGLPGSTTALLSASEDQEGLGGQGLRGGGLAELGRSWSGPGEQKERGRQAGAGAGSARGAWAALRMLSPHCAGTWDLEEGPQETPAQDPAGAAVIPGKLTAAALSLSL